MEVQRKYGVATAVNVPMLKVGSQDFAASGDWTPATGDVKISKNEGTAVNIGTLPTVIDNMDKWKFAFSATEMEAKRVSITVVDVAAQAVEGQAIEISTYGNASAEHTDRIEEAWDALRADHNAAGTMGEGVLVEDLNTAAKASVNTEVDGALNTAVPGAPTANSINERVKAIDDKLPSSGNISNFDSAVDKVDVEKLDGGAQSLLDLKDFADAGYDPATNKVEGVKLVDTTTTNSDMRGTDSAALASVCTSARLSELDAATGGKMANVVDALDTLIKAAGDGDLAAVKTAADAIKVVTDKFVFTVANQVDGNTKSINDKTLTGDGSSGTPWGPA